MTITPKRLADVLENRGVKVAIYGKSAVGKTSQIRHVLEIAGEDDVVAVITAEHGLRTLKQYEGVVEDERLAILEVSTLAETREAVAWAKATATWVIVDSVSNLADRELRAKLGEKPDPRQAYGEVGVKVPDILWALVDCGHLHVIFIFQENEHIKNEGTASRPDFVSYYSPEVPSNRLKAAMPYIFECVLRLEHTPSGERRFRTLRTPTIEAKDRTGKLSEYEAADIGSVITKILSE